MGPRQSGFAMHPGRVIAAPVTAAAKTLLNVYCTSQIVMITPSSLRSSAVFVLERWKSFDTSGDWLYPKAD
jgi:hypothetical protein